MFSVIENATIRNVIIGSDAKIQGGDYTAGIVANVEGERNIIQHCINNANVNGINNTAGIVGGIKGGIVLNCGNTGNITGEGHRAGGVICVCSNYTNVNISGCYNWGNINATGKTVYGASEVGGIIGNYYEGLGSIEDCYNTGTISAVYPNFGGIVGGRESSGALIKNCYNIGNIMGSSNRGSIVGYSEGTKLQNCYWTTSLAISGEPSGTITTCSKKTEAELKALSSILGDKFIADGKIENTEGEWVDNLNEKGDIIYINNGYPILKWQLESK